MSIITKSINGRAYMLFEGGYTRENARKRVRSLNAMQLNRHGEQHARMSPYEGEYGIFIKMRPDMTK